MPTPPTLRDIDYRIYYQTHDDPLATFYLPSLAASVSYDRSAGYFRSSALAAAAAGIVRLIANGGRMRLLVGADLLADDVAAIRQGYDLRQAVGRAMLRRMPAGDAALDGPLQQRLDALTWMVANGTLEMKVVLPLDADGYPIPGDQAADYYHEKKGVFTDAHGHQVAFVGSTNESDRAWQHNYESFAVYCSWQGGREAEGLAQVRASFNDLWDGRHPNWVAVALPEAVRQALIKLAPRQPPARDPLEPQPAAPPQPDAGPDRDRLLFQFARDAPYLSRAADLGAATSAVTPFPHQLQVARAVVARFPDRALLCDEVGLGKTIEAGLIIRQLVLSGAVRRGLILTPKAVLRQWQEELYEKFNLHIPRYEDGLLIDVDGRALGPPVAEPWDQEDLLLASSHLVKRRERVPQLLRARPWDLLVVDEAHHARRKEFLQPTYRPNRLLTLLNGLREQERYRGLLLLTATPMQVHPVEVWDLLTVLGLGGRWGADAANFLGFFNELRRPAAEADWNFVYDLVADHLDSNGPAGGIDPAFYQAMRAAIGAPHANAIRDLPHQRGRRDGVVRHLPPEAQDYLGHMARRHTPLQHYLFRNTRNLLRTYVAKGLLQANVPRRRPTVRRVTFLPEEESLYQRVEEYISNFYAKYEAERRGLGFIMTVYRRRLTSSFAAARQSLERRRDWLRGQVAADRALTPEDEADLEELIEGEAEQEEMEFYEQDPRQPLTAGQKALYQAELDYLDGFITDLRALSDSDSKTKALKEELAELFRQRPTVLIFTQYTDTMDYLREQLQTVYRGQIACYSGRGGEVWQGTTWRPTTKEEVKTRFRDEQIKILLCTESASEGLNLQTCGVLINYDMPWNPMRVEQRIGRIDRIGQRYEEVWIYHYFYRDTIEDRIYQALQDRIAWFEAVVGALQPILAEVSKVTRDLAMLPAARREAELQEAIRRLEAQIEQAQVEALDIDAYLPADDPRPALETPLTLAELEALLTEAAATRRLFAPHETIAGAYWLKGNGEPLAVTFDAALFDAHPDTLRFLSYGSPLLAELLAAAGESAATPDYLLRLAGEGGRPLRAWYDLRRDEPRPVASLAELRRALTEGGAEAAGARQAAQQQFAAAVAAAAQATAERASRQRRQQRAILQARAARLLQQAAIVTIVLGEQRTLYDTAGYPTGFNEEAVTALAQRGVVWQWLLVIATDEGRAPVPTPSAGDPLYEALRPSKPEELRRRLGEMEAQGRPIVTAWRGMGAAA